MPCSEAVASGRFGVRSPSKYGIRTTPPAPAGPVSVAPGAPLSAAARPTGEVAHADTGRREVALTFHGAGDERLARRVLTLLHDHGAAGTVLAVGTWLRQYPDAGRMVVDLGHELGNHTWSHPDLAARYRVQGIPNFIVFKGGQPVFQQAGVVPAAAMRRWIDDAAR